MPIDWKGLWNIGVASAKDSVRDDLKNIGIDVDEVVDEFLGEKPVTAKEVVMLPPEESWLTPEQVRQSHPKLHDYQGQGEYSRVLLDILATHGITASCEKPV